MKIFIVFHYQTCRSLQDIKNLLCKAIFNFILISDEIKKQEIDILQCLSFKISFPTTLKFLYRLI